VNSTKNKPHSYKELPNPLREFGTVYRYEQSGELQVLTREEDLLLRMNAHIFCRPDQVKEEFYQSECDLVLPCI